MGIFGDYVIISADVESYNAGSIYIYTRNGTTWTNEQNFTASSGAAIDYYGCSVSISGDYAIVGAYGDDDNGSYSGSAYIYH